MEGVPAVGALPSASWAFGSLHGVVLGWPGGLVPFLKIAFPQKIGTGSRACNVALASSCRTHVGLRAAKYQRVSGAPFHRLRRQVAPSCLDETDVTIFRSLFRQRLRGQSSTLQASTEAGPAGVTVVFQSSKYPFGGVLARALKRLTCRLSANASSPRKCLIPPPLRLYEVLVRLRFIEYWRA